MRRLTDLTDYKGVLPDASEIFGIYQPLLGWRSGRVRQRIGHGARTWLTDIVRRLGEFVQPTYTARFAAADCTLSIDAIGPGTVTGSPSFGGMVVAQVAHDLPPRDEYTPDVWSSYASAEYLGTVLKRQVAPAAVERYRQLCAGAGATRTAQRGNPAETQVRAFLDRESRTAGLLESLADNRRFGVLEELFYGQGERTRHCGTSSTGPTTRSPRSTRPMS